MGLDFSTVGVDVGPVQVSWDDRDVMLYALGVGAGQLDACDELTLTTENSEGLALQVLPGFAASIVQKARLRPFFGDIDWTRLVHAGQRVHIHTPLPAQGRAAVSARVESMEDKRSGALVRIVSEAREASTGLPLFTSESSLFIKGHGGFGGAPGRVVSGITQPACPPDLDVYWQTRIDQALLYRLSGDRNPLHSDPVSARRSGFERPILHGLCSLGGAIRLLCRSLAIAPADVIQLEGRFTGSAYPGERLRVLAWSTGPAVQFQVVNDCGRSVIERGSLEYVA